jgi:uncharacterized Zn finger protein
MERICQQKTGLFPSPNEIELSCSCPDWAQMCKHVAAVLYGVGARLDERPELLFRLHELDERELIAEAGNELPLSKERPAATKILNDSEDLSALFGLDMAQNTISNKEPVSRVPSRPKRSQLKSDKNTTRQSAKKTADRTTKTDSVQTRGKKS